MPDPNDKGKEPVRPPAAGDTYKQRLKRKIEERKRIRKKSK